MTAINSDRLSFGVHRNLFENLRAETHLVERNIKVLTRRRPTVRLQCADMNRRQFFYTCTTVGTISRISGAFSPKTAKYDLIVRGGRVIDPSRELNAVRDIAIARGHITTITANLDGSAIEIIDARGKLVVPGLIDVHTHVTRVKDGAAICLSDGVTAAIDAGSQGADGIDEAIATARLAPQPCRVLINIGRRGVLQEGDTMEINLADVAAAREAISRNREMIVGVKARLSQNVTGSNDLEVLRRSQEVASAFSLPVMIHMGQTASPLAKLLPMLKPGGYCYSHVCASSKQHH